MAMNPARLQMLRRLRPELGNLPDAQVAAMFGENEPSTTPIDMAQLIPQAQTVTPCRARAHAAGPDSGSGTHAGAARPAAGYA